MYEEYDEITAEHYLAYRPPLHKLILDRIVGSDNYFQLGLDIGCGTGQSSIALSEYCNKVVGIEPSSYMLNFAISKPKVEYHFYGGNALNFPDYYFDIITFAGSLFYAKSQKLLDEVIRVSKHLALVVTYDFQIMLEDLLNELNIDGQINNDSYNHEENFSGLNGNELRELTHTKEECRICIRPSDLSHLLLSQKNIYMALTKKYNIKEPYPILKTQLSELPEDSNELIANIYFTTYQCYK